MALPRILPLALIPRRAENILRPFQPLPASEHIRPREAHAPHLPAPPSRQYPPPYSNSCRVAIGTYPTSNPGGGVTISAGSKLANLPTPGGGR